MGKLVPRRQEGPAGQAKGGKTGIFVVDPQGREPRRIAPEGYDLVAGGNALSPDGLLWWRARPRIRSRSARSTEGNRGRFQA